MTLQDVIDKQQRGLSLTSIFANLDDGDGAAQLVTASMGAGVLHNKKH